MWDSDSFNFISCLSQVIRLKYYIEKEDVEAILNIFEKSHEILKSIYQIFVNSTVPDCISANHQIK